MIKTNSFKIIVAYDGTDYHGWQSQSNAITISSCLQDTFQKTFSHSVKLIGASRTDAKVHALGQVVRVRTNLKIDAQKILTTWNNALPKSILIRSIEEKDFNPCCNVLQKSYYYHLFLSRPLPLFARYGWFYRFINRVNLEKFEKALQLYVGEHDFASFCKMDDKSKSTVRKIDSINLKYFSRFGVIRIEIRGKSFLRFQIRRMIGYAMDTARKESFSINNLKNILDNPNPQQILLKADGCGLCLRKVVYYD